MLIRSIWGYISRTKHILRVCVEITQLAMCNVNNIIIGAALPFAFRLAYQSCSHIHIHVPPTSTGTTFT